MTRPPATQATFIGESPRANVLHNAMLGKTINQYHDYFAKINEERGRKFQKPCRESWRVRPFLL